MAGWIGPAVRGDDSPAAGRRCTRRSRRDGPIARGALRADVVEERGTGEATPAADVVRPDRPRRRRAASAHRSLEGVVHDAPVAELLDVAAVDPEAVVVPRPGLERRRVLEHVVLERYAAV